MWSVPHIIGTQLYIHHGWCGPLKPLQDNKKIEFCTVTFEPWVSPLKIQQEKISKGCAKLRISV
jgi:hypothetical protein